MSRVTRSFLSVCILVLVSWGVAAQERGVAPQDASAFVNEFGHRAIVRLTAPNLSDEELVGRFRELFDEGFDVPYIARSALGRFWPLATDRERAEYVPLFEDYNSWVYALQFRHYSGESFRVDRARPESEDIMTIESTVMRRDGPMTKIDWSVASVGGTMKIRDIKIEGVSMIISHRDEFANAIQQRGGRIEGLIEALRDKLAELRAPQSR